MANNSEFSHKIPVEDVYRRASGKGVTLVLAPKPDECKALAQRCGVEAVDDFSAKISLAPVTRETVRISGTLEATVTRLSLIGGESYTQKIQDQFDEIQTTNDEVYQAAAGDDTDHDTVVEMIEGDFIDVGELVTQYLALALDPVDGRMSEGDDDTSIEPFQHIEDQGAIDRDGNGTTNTLAEALKKSGLGDNT